MPLILAIEPDRQQASKLAALARGPLKADLFVAESTERAFEALGNRVPDLVLTSLWLSPKDESALAGRLRDLDASGARVQTLVIPVLSSPQRRKGTKSGLLNMLRRSTPDSSPEGCDPEVFAEQIDEYLKRAAAEREQFADLEDDDHLGAPARPQPPEPEPRLARQSVHEHHDEAFEPHLNTQASVIDEAAYFDELRAAASQVIPESVEPPSVARSSFHEDLDTTSEPVEAARSSAPHYDAVLDEPPEPVVEAPPVPSAEGSSQDDVITVESIDLEAFVRELEAAANLPTVSNERAVPQRHAGRSRASQQSRPESASGPDRARVEGTSPARTPRPKDLDDDIAEFLAALPKFDKKRSETPAARVAPAVPTAPEKTTEKTEAEPAPRPRRRTTRTRVPNEWSFFDAERSGFSSLLAKLDELADLEQSSVGRRA